MSQTLSIIIPAYNEAQTLVAILDKVMDVRLIAKLEKEVIIVDDGSTDNTREVAATYIEQAGHSNIRLIELSHNTGKGGAIHRGIEEATGDFIVIQDADLEYDPKDFNHLLQPVVDGVADVVYGSRFMGGKPHRILFFWHSIGNKFLTFLSNMFSNLNLTDIETCYKLFRSDVIKPIKLREKRFGFEPEVTAKIANVPKIKIYEVGIAYYGRTYDEGKKIGWRDGFKAIYCILRYNLFP